MKEIPINQADVAASFQKSVTDVLVGHAMSAIDEYKMDKFAIAGGVASNGTLRKAMEEACAKKGVKFYLDDFGIGYSNLAMVMELPFETVKLDASLLWESPLILLITANIAFVAYDLFLTMAMRVYVLKYRPRLQKYLK